MRAAVTILALLLAAMVARADTAGVHVRVDLVADTSAVAPGRPFTVGVRFAIDPGWHIYWTNPGDSGTPTRVRFAFPAGYSVGPVRFPLPTVLHLPGGLTNYGYQGEVMLTAQVTPPATGAATVTVTAHVDYLVCADVCLPGKATPSIVLPLGPPAVANGDLFRRWAARLPASPPHAFAVHYDRERPPADSAYHVRVEWPTTVKNVEWVPPPTSGLDMENVHVVTLDQLTTIDFVLTPEGPGPRPTQACSLLLFDRPDGSHAGIELPIYPNQPSGLPRSSVVGTAP